jgi:hypothetical protein
MHVFSKGVVLTETYKLVSYSRAGDIFHYRWAARRCLRLLNFNSSLDCLIIEGSKEKIAGEYIIDVAEYQVEEGINTVEYFQLKHSTTQVDKPFTLSLLKDTFEGFATRYKALLKNDSGLQSIKFSIITNRPISLTLKSAIKKISSGEKVTSKIKKTLEKYTKLKGNKLQSFCLMINLVDGEGNYDSQKYEIHKDLKKLITSADSTVVESLIALVQEKVVTPDNNKILREDVLRKFGVTSEKELFPCVPEFEYLNKYVFREQHKELQTEIINAKSPLIISASGGVGKSIVCCQLANDFENGSYAITYDCFGNGKYRKLSEKRHRACDAFIQISNELAREGLCEPLIPQPNDQDDRLMRSFLERLEVASGNIKKCNELAILVIMVDAADNAEMAADEFGDVCFASQLLKENIPENCRVVMFARPERVKLLKPSSLITELSLRSFSDEETLHFLRQKFDEAKVPDGIEFRRLTDGNPRVQANALDVGFATVSDVLSSLGPFGTSVDDLIEAQLESAVTKIKESYPNNFQVHIDAICTGLANLPPFIPLDVLSAVAGVEINDVKSFVADLGRPLWLTDNAVQFRDEPTETWFRDKFAATENQVKAYIAELRPISFQSPYVAEALPSLLLLAGLYEELITLALSDDLLPEESPIDARNIRVYRLQFAFKAALKQERYFDAAKLAFRAGEEVAGDSRQIQVLSENIDLIAPLQSNERVQELAHRRMIRGSWEGSENIYSASLLATLNECKGEARGYLRAAERWLQLYFEDRDKQDDDKFHQEKLNDQDILEMEYTVLNLYGARKATSCILSWKPDKTIFRVAQLLSRRLIDKAEFSLLNEVLRHGIDCPVFVLAITNELMEIGKAPDKKILTRCLNKIIVKNTRIDKPGPIYEKGISSNVIISFLEACVIHKIPERNIKRALNYYIDEPRVNSIADNFSSVDRTVFMRVLAIRASLSGKFNEDVDALIPKRWLKESTGYEDEQEVKEAKEAMSALLPWYMVKARILAGENIKLSTANEEAIKHSGGILSHRYREHDLIPFEVSNARFINQILIGKEDKKELGSFFSKLADEKSNFRLNDKIQGLRACYRLEHMEAYRDVLEASCYETAIIVDDEGPEEHARWFIKIARAVLPESPNDASAYFDHAIEVVSKFGDELIERWEAVVSVAQRSSEGNIGTPELAYRFMRCAELVGNSVYREKHFDRNGAVETCFSLCPKSTFSIMSRWKDRDVGWADSQLPTLAGKVLESGLITPSASWSLSAFSWDYGAYDFMSICLDKETKIVNQQYILDCFIRDLRCRGIAGNVWKDINKLCQKYKLNNGKLQNNEALLYDDNLHNYKRGDEFNGTVRRDDNQHDWNVLLAGIDLTNSHGINKAISIFDSLKGPRDSDQFWKNVFSLVSVRNLGKFLISVSDAEEIDLYDIERAFSNIPKAWKSKPSVRIAWQKSISLIAKCFASELTNEYRRNSFLNAVGNSDDNICAINKGVLKGLSESCNLVSASTLYGFARTSVSLISPDQAKKLLGFSLFRFEEHIQPEYADGEWGEWMLPPSNMEKALSGYIWSSLGSPRSSERWRAAHAVKILCDLKCHSEIESLLEWMIKEEVDSFGCKDYPFYYLHAKQYLLIALSRAVIDSATLLKKHKNLFMDIAVDGEHVLIQKHAVDIALEIESAFPNSYSSEEILNIKAVVSSPLPIKYSDKYSETFDTPWHVSGEIYNHRKLSFNFEFDSYWFEPLGRVFGISSKQVEDLARTVVFKDWNTQIDDEYISDPRKELWKSRRYDREISHSHGEYPSTDNYSFYLSYHAMLNVASKLLSSMPVIHSREWQEDEWGEWLQRHSITRADNKWLADRRDPIPLERRVWVKEEKDESWRWQITSNDFLESLFVEREGEKWLNVTGSWNEYIDGYDENFYIQSMLVPMSASQSLMNAIVTSEDTRGYGLINFAEPDYDNETNEQPFQLQQWINRDHISKCLDEHDPFTGNIDYPPYTISDSIIEQFNLVSDNEKRYWYVPESNKESLVTQIWSEDKTEKRGGYIRKGHRVQASFEFLIDLCSKTDSDLIFEVQINRQLTNSYSRRDDDDFGYPPPYRQIYVLSKDGRFRDSRKSYKFRKKVS